MLCGFLKSQGEMTGGGCHLSLSRRESPSEARTQMELQIACGQLILGVPESTGRAIKIGIDACEVNSIEQVGDLTASLDPHLLTEEPGHVEELLKGEIEIVITGPVVSATPQVSLLSQRRGREGGSSRRTEDPLQELLVAHTAQTPSKARGVGDVIVSPVGVVVPTRVADDVATRIEDRGKGRTRRYGKRQARRHDPDTAELPATESVAFERVPIVVRHNPVTIRGDLLMDTEVCAAALILQILPVDHARSGCDGSRVKRVGLAHFVECLAQGIDAAQGEAMGKAASRNGRAIVAHGIAGGTGVLDRS